MLRQQQRLNRVNLVYCIYIKGISVLLVEEADAADVVAGGILKYFIFK